MSSELVTYREARELGCSRVDAAMIASQTFVTKELNFQPRGQDMLPSPEAVEAWFDQLNARLLQLNLRLLEGIKYNLWGWRDE